MTRSYACSPRARRTRSRARHERLAKAIADFDAATIETTHGFCLQVLSGLGDAGDVERDVTLVEDARDLLEEVVDDLYVRRFWAQPGRAAVRPRRSAPDRRGGARHPTADDRPEPEATSATREPSAGAWPTPCADEIDWRKRELNVLTYDDVLIRLRDTLADPLAARWRAPAARSRYEVVLVDEFQDTDPVQWDIMRLAFGDGGLDARAHRRPETGHLRLPGRRRLRLPRGGANRPPRRRRCR